MKKVIYPILTAVIISSWLWMFTFDIWFTLSMSVFGAALGWFAGSVEDKEENQP